MSKFSDWIKDIPENSTIEIRHEPAELATAVVSGAFGCQWCDLIVSAASYDGKEKRLNWKCADGHDSSIRYNL